MATITVTFTHPSISHTRTFTLPDADLARIATAARAVYKKQGESSITNAIAVQRVTDDFFGHMRRFTKHYEVEEAKKAAATTVVAIEAT